MRPILITLFLLFSLGCTGIPKGITPVENFELNRYLGKWFEIARLDHSFEQGLNQVTAEYQLEGDRVKVINRGYDEESKQWKVAEGKAYLVADDQTGHLKVSFFGPFYGSYIIFELDHENYQYAFIASYDKSYLWLLSRAPDLDQTIIDQFIQVTQSLGYETDKLIFVKQN